jgi:hypothetical protein
MNRQSGSPDNQLTSSTTTVVLQTVVGVGIVIATAVLFTLKLKDPRHNRPQNHQIDRLSQSELETVFDDILQIDDVAMMDQWRRDRHRTKFINCDADTIDRSMAWCRRFVSQTLPNGIWCLISSRINGVVLSTERCDCERFTNDHIRTTLVFRVHELSTDNLISCDIAFDSITVVYDIVRVYTGEMNNSTSDEIDPVTGTATETATGTAAETATDPDYQIFALLK